MSSRIASKTIPTLKRIQAVFLLKNIESPLRLWILSIALAKILFHAIISAHWEFQRDAFLYLAQAAHPAWGYFSTPPLTAWVLAVVTGVFGDGVFVVRMIPALLGSMTLLLVAQITWRLKGHGWAVMLASLAYLLSPAYLRTASLIQPVGFDIFFWVLTGFLTLHLLQSRDTRTWFWLALTWALAWYAKYSIGVLILATVMGILVTRHRRLLDTRFWQAGLLGFVLILPNLIWQWSYQWPVIGHISELAETQLVNVQVGQFLGMQLLMNAHALLIWLAGAIALLWGARFRSVRPLGWIAIIAFIIILLLRGKAYYSLGLYPMLFAAGAVVLEQFFFKWHPVVRHAFMGLLIVGSLPVLPFGAPILKPEPMAAYSAYWSQRGLEGLVRWEDGEVYALPQDHADMLGWKEITDLALSAYRSLSPEEQRQTIIYADNYGLAGAARYYGQRELLREPISFNDQFLLWAPETLDAAIIIEISEPFEDPPPYYASVERFASLNNPLSRSNGSNIYIGRNPQDSLIMRYSEIIQWRQVTYGH